MQLQDIINSLKDSDFVASLGKEYAVGDEENRAVMFEARKAKGKSPESTQFRQMVQSYRTPQAIRAALGLELDSDYNTARKKIGVEFDVSNAQKKAGTVLGAIGSDLTQDSARRFWWLLNAFQAVGDMGTEEVIYRARRADPVPSKKNPFTASGARRPQEEPKEFISELYSTVPDPKNPGQQRRKYGPGAVKALGIPAGIAINTGLGLMTPFGGAEGYKAALPSEDDPTKTSNVIGEIAAKYFLGRTGDLLPYDEFVKVRPDVSKDEYRRYKAFKFDKSEDYNPFDDGQAGALMGALKYTSEGIHGPEVQFLGRSLPVTTGFIPYLGATAGAAAGVRYGGKRPIATGLAGGFGGLAAGNIVGNLVEAERRRRNAAENELDKL